MRRDIHNPQTPHPPLNLKELVDVAFALREFLLCRMLVSRYTRFSRGPLSFRQRDRALPFLLGHLLILTILSVDLVKPALDERNQILNQNTVKPYMDRRGLLEFLTLPGKGLVPKVLPFIAMLKIDDLPVD